MKIAFIIYNLDKGGAERVVSLLSLELSKKHNVSIIVFNNTITYNHGGKIIDLKSSSKSSKFGKVVNVFIRVLKLKEVFQKEKFDKVFAFMETAYLPAILTGFPIIASIRNNPYKYSKYITKHILPRAKKIIAPSLEIKNILEKKFNIKNSITINNPIDFQLIDKLKNEQIEEKFDFMVAAGRLHYQKGFDLLVEAYSLSSAKKKIKLLIFGDGELRKNIQKQIDEKNLTNFIILKGKTENLYKYLSKAKMFILSSRYEGFPNVLIEALACNVSCIATNCPTGPDEIIKNESNGLLVINEDIKDLSKAIDRLFFNTELQKKFRDNARKSVEHLSINKIAQKWIDI